MPDRSAPESNSEFVERLKGLSPADRARAFGEEAVRNLQRFDAARRRWARQAQQFGQWVMIGFYGVFAVVAWIAYWYLEPALGAELGTGLVALASIFAALGGIRLGNRSEAWYLGRRDSPER